MKILHGTWIPDGHDDFIQSGAFYLWVETDEGVETGEVRANSRKGAGKAKTVSIEGVERYPWQPSEKGLKSFFTAELGLPDITNSSLGGKIVPCFFTLPTAKGKALPSLELSRYCEMELPQSFEWQTWQIDCYRVTNPVPRGTRSPIASVSACLSRLKDLHFMAQYELVAVHLGADLLFWHYFSQAFKQVVLKDHYIPALAYRALEPNQEKDVQTKGAKRSPKGSATKSNNQKPNPRSKDVSFVIYPHWEIASDIYESILQKATDYMPLICTAGFSQPSTALQLHDSQKLLRHFSECLLTDMIASTTWSQAIEKSLDGSLVSSCIQLTDGSLGSHWVPGTGLERYRQWQGWRDRITRSQNSFPFYFCFQLEAPDNAEGDWLLNFQVAPKEHPSLRIALSDYWRLKPIQQQALKLQIGENFEQDLLLTLGDAARIYPQLRGGLETDEPVGIVLTTDAAFDFLSETAWVLENAGYKVIVPAWWTPQGRRKAQLRLKANSKSAGGKDKSKSYFSLDTLVEYEYELSIGGEPVSEAEWQRLIEANEPLVQFRGQWLALEPEKMQEMVNFWKQHRQENPEMSLMDFMKLTANQGEQVEVDFSRDRTLISMMDKLTGKSALVPIQNPQQLSGELREYQKRGVSWLNYLESLGLNGCLADDMGLGKTIQVIARLLQEKEALEEAEKPARKKKTKTSAVLPPTLLIAPTSVVGNWRKELEKFAPTLRIVVHHGIDRVKTKTNFTALCEENDVIITSFSLARLDSALFDSVDWHRIVLDEAQNIKNPQSAQTKAILKLSAQHRLALTGTPVENRLLDLWSIFNFLNPGYLGKQAQFRKTFELPIQKNNDITQSAVLKKLVEPFILRRVKTDEAIIKDLPAKVEQKLYCNLTKEQASLYAATVRDVEKQLKVAEGIQRKGLMLSTLLKLKQICNHPMQFLQDGSDFTATRSHKLSRLREMVAEAIADGDSLLIFTQFKELGDALEKYLRQEEHYNTYYLHGGVTRQKRDRLMAEFQDPDTEPSIFILSLKAGGVGITLTKANHVFHFDRWWNPAVEDQATDRAFRIGQRKNVFVHKFVAIGTLEERIDQMIEDKKKLAGSIVGSDESWLTELDNNAFKQLIALNKTALLE
jgi:SNF2 family DNA or RNA helicase